MSAKKKKNGESFRFFKKFGQRDFFRTFPHFIQSIGMLRKKRQIDRIGNAIREWRTGSIDP